MRRTRWLLLLAAASVLLGSTRWGLLAQEKEVPAPEPVFRNVGKPRVTIEEAMLRPFTLPFAEETSLAEVARTLQKALDAPVVLDLAAVKRRGQTPESTVKLELRDVRLKTGLKLLLDQVGMTFRIVPEDNLLVLTDEQGTEDPGARVLAELKILRREMNELLDAVDGLTHSLMPVEEIGPAIRNPTIIEDMPPEKQQPKGQGQDEDRPARTRPG